MKEEPTAGPLKATNKSLYRFRDEVSMRQSQLPEDAASLAQLNPASLTNMMNMWNYPAELHQQANLLQQALSG